MDNQSLSINANQIIVVPGVVQFDEYEKLRHEASQLAVQIEQVEVSDENIQASKKLLAAVNKRVKEMEDRRIAIKKEMLAPYNEFEQQVKDIVSIVKGADHTVRVQVRELEEKERIEKRSKISELFEKRMKQYNFGEMFGFEDFLKQQHLNKTVSINAVEVELVGWLEKIENDLEAIQSLPDSALLLTEYYESRDLTTAIQSVKKRAEREQKVIELAKHVKKSVSHVYVVTVYSKADSAIIQDYMHLNNINYTIEKVEK